MRARVAVVIITYQQAHYLESALDSVFKQTRAADEIVVVDDGSTDEPAAVVSRRSGVRLVRQANAGSAAARNRGLDEVDTDFVIFLDADDLLTPIAIEAGLKCFALHPEAGFVYGAHRRVDATGQELTGCLYQAIRRDPYAALLCGNVVAMLGAVMFRRCALAEAGSFDVRQRRAADYDVYLRIAQRHPVASHPREVAHYRRHGTNLSNNNRQEMRAVLDIHRKYRPAHDASPELRVAWREGRRNWRRYYAITAADDARILGRSRLGKGIVWAWVSPAGLKDRALGRVGQEVAAVLPGAAGRAFANRFGFHRPRQLGRTALGDLASVRPVSQDFGWDRGDPIDRYYIDKFISSCADDIRGHVLEVGDASYSHRFGGTRVTQQDVLHVKGNQPAATLTGDISQPDVLPEATFDCIILTETLQLVYDIPAAVRHLHAALKPGGVLLVTVPGIRQLDRGEWADSWYWSLTVAAALRLLEDSFGVGQVEAEAHGNVFAAIVMLTGLAQSEVDVQKLDIHDPAYPVVVTARAVREPVA